MAAYSGVSIGAARSMPQCMVPQRMQKQVVRRAPLTGSTALGRAASRAAASADGALGGAAAGASAEEPQGPWRAGAGGGGGVVAEAGEEVFEGVAAREVALPVGELGVEGAELVPQLGFAGPQLGHPVP